MAADPSLVIRVAANLAEFKRNLAEGRNQVETLSGSFQKLSASFSGDKIIQAAHNVAAAVNQIGGASKLTEAEQARVNRTVEAALQKYAALGKEAPRALHELASATARVEQPTSLLSSTVGRLASGFAIGALVDRGVSALMGFAREALSSAGATADLADKLGVSTTAIQKYAFVAGQTGTSTEAFASAVFRLGINLSGGSDSVRSAVEAVGVQFSTLRNLKPEDQFDVIAAALGGVEDASERNRLGVQLFGKSFSEIAAAVAQGYREMADQATVSGENQIRALDRAGDALDRMKNAAGAAATMVLGTLWEGVENFATMFSAAFTGPVEAAAVAIKQMGAAAQSTEQPITDWNAALLAAHESVNRLTASERQQIDSAMRLGASSSELATQFGITEQVLRLYVQRVRESEQAARAAEAGTRQHASAVEQAGVIWGEMGTIVRFQIAGVLTPNLLDLVSGTNNAAQAMQDLRDELARVGQQAIQIQPALQNLARLPWVEFRQSVQQTGTETEGFFARIFGGAQQMSTNLSSLFQSAFVGGGGALGAVKAFATQTLTSLFGMIPGIGQWAGALASVVVSTFSKLWGWISDGFRRLFGGPSADELAGRELVAKFEDNIIAMLTDAQRLEAGTDRWRQVLIGVRDAVMAAGLSHDQALALVEKLWASSKNGATASQAVIAEITRLMQQQGSAGAAAVDKLAAALANLPDVVDFEIRGTYRAPDLPREGYAGGTIARGSWFRDFGAATATVLHGTEAVVTPAQAPAFAQAVLGGGDPELKRLIRDLPRSMKLAVREAMVMA